MWGEKPGTSIQTTRAPVDRVSAHTQTHMVFTLLVDPVFTLLSLHKLDTDLLLSSKSDDQKLLGGVLF